jgi:hypothetical protein
MTCRVGSKGIDGMEGTSVLAERVAAECRSRQTILLARRTRTMKRCSSDARSK